MHVLSIALLEIHGCKRDHARRVRLRTPMRERLMGEPVEGISGEDGGAWQQRYGVHHGSHHGEERRGRRGQIGTTPVRLKFSWNCCDMPDATHSQ